MKWMALVALAATALAAQTPARAQAPAAEPICASDGQFRFLCGQRAEDILRIPGTDWILASGTLRAINAGTRLATPIYPAPTAATRFDRAAYGDCPDAALANFGTLGLSLLRQRGGGYRLYATDLRNRVVQVLDLRIRGNEAPVATWLGCVPVPPDTGLNSVAALPDGSGFVMTTWQPPNGGPDARARMEAGEINGAVWEWRAGKGWTRIAGSETSGGNGIEVSRDGRQIYAVGWGNRTFFRMVRGANPPKRDTVQLDFRVDNLRWAPDGKLLATGPTATGWKVAKIDPDTLKVTDVLARADEPGFRRASAAIEVGDELWVSTPFTDRIALVAKPK